MTDNKSILILVVDDEPVARQGLARIIKVSLHHKVIIASNGKQAVRKAHLNKPDLIITDLRMPGMDGLELIRLLKDNEETKDICIILLTAFWNTETAADASRAGINDYLLKPTSPKAILQSIEKVLRGKRLGL